MSSHEESIKKNNRLLKLNKGEIPLQSLSTVMRNAKSDTSVD